MDSVALAYWLRPPFAITIDYGQLAAAAEIQAARAVSEELDIIHHLVTVDTIALGSGDMAGKASDSLAPATDWWPFRNQLLATLAAMKVVPLGVTKLILGTVMTDQSHRDGTPGFLERLDMLMAYQEGGIRVEAPAIGFTTVELIRTSRVPRSLLAWAHSCHRATTPCGGCRGCNKHFETLRDLDA